MYYVIIFPDISYCSNVLFKTKEEDLSRNFKKKQKKNNDLGYKQIVLKVSFVLKRGGFSFLNI